MKSLIILLVLLWISGCSTLSSVPRTKTKEIFTKVKNRDSKEALNLFNQTNNDSFEGYWDSYSNLKRHQVRRLISVGSNYIESCEGMISKVKELKVKHSDYGSDVSKVKNIISNMKRNFKFICEFENSSPRDLQKIKDFSSVDLLSEKDGLVKRFYPQISRLESEIRSYHKKKKDNESQRLSDKKKYKNSPEYYNKKICEFQRNIKLAKEAIEEEKKAAEDSGFVDKVKMYRAGKMKKINEKWFKERKKEYKSKFGKSWSPEQC